MGQYEVKHQTDFIIVPGSDVIFPQNGSDDNAYIRIDDMAALDDIIEQCRTILYNMTTRLA